MRFRYRVVWPHPGGSDGALEFGILEVDEHEPSQRAAAEGVARILREQGLQARVQVCAPPWQDLPPETEEV